MHARALCRSSQRHSSTPASGAACRCRACRSGPTPRRGARPVGAQRRSQTRDAPRRGARRCSGQHAVDERRRQAGVGAERRAGTSRRAPACRRRTPRRARGRLPARSAARSSGRARPPSRRRRPARTGVASSLMNVTDVARNALMACLVISADSTDIHSMRSVIGARELQSRSPRSRSPRTPTTTRSGCVKTSIALPSRRFSGEQAKPDAAPVDRAASALEPAALPTGSCDELSTSAPSVEVREGAANVGHDELDVGAIVVVDRRVEGDPDDVGVARPPRASWS